MVVMEHRCLNNPLQHQHQQEMVVAVAELVHVEEMVVHQDLEQVERVLT
jgi:hypothetical protein